MTSEVCVGSFVQLLGQKDVLLFADVKWRKRNQMFGVCWFYSLEIKCGSILYLKRSNYC